MTTEHFTKTVNLICGSRIFTEVRLSTLNILKEKTIHTGYEDLQ